MIDKTDLITPERLAKYFDVTSRALDKAKILAGSKEIDVKAVAEDFYDMAERYFKDAKHFESEGKVVLAYGALNYAHAWLDAGARLEVFDVNHDSVLFTVD